MRTIPYGHQWIGAEEIREIAKTLRSDWFTQGPRVKEFEGKLCDYTGAKYVVAVSSGTAALHVACLAANVGCDDEVITSPLTFLASANCALYCGANPVFADIQEDTANIDPKEILKNISKKTKAIIPVHFSGLPCDLKKINSIAKANDLLVIEDAAHALGAEYGGLKIGSCKFSDITTFSFHPVKSITTGEGGALLTNRKDLYDRALEFRNHGITKDKRKFTNKGMRDCQWYYEMQSLGFNYRITDIQAALGVVQLKKLTKFISRRRKISHMYDAAFRNNPYFDIPAGKAYMSSARHLYPILLKGRFLYNKVKIFNALRDNGLGVQVHYMPVYLQPYYMKMGFKRGLCKKAENYYNREISIPLYPAMGDKEVMKVINVINKVFKELCKCK